MPDKPSLFSKLFRKTKSNLESQKKPAAASTPVPPPATPVKPKQPVKPEKIKLPLTGGKIETYLTCPKKFEYAYIAKSSSARPTSPYLSFDSTLHYTLKAYYKSKKPEAPFKLEQLLQLMGAQWDNRGYENPEQEQEFRIEAENAMRRYFARYCNVPSRAKEIDYFFKIDLFGCEYSGKFDRVDVLPDGGFEIIDYKTGKPPRGGIEELSSTLSVQLAFLAGDIIWPGKVRKITFIYLKDDSALTLIKNNSDLALAKKRYLDIGEAIYRGKFEAVRSQACAFCDFNEICPTGRIPSLNATKIRTFLECPHKYSLVYLERSVPYTEKEPSFDLALDRPLHEALASLHRDYSTQTVEDPLSFLLAAYYKAVPDSIPDDLSDQVKEAGREYLENYMEAFFRHARTKYVNEFISYLTDKFEFQTTIDRIDADEAGDLELIDYKSGKRVMEEGEIKMDPVACVTAAAAAARWPGKVKWFTWIFLRTGRSVTLQIDDYMIRKGNNILSDIAQSIHSKRFDPMGGSACGFCAASRQCGTRMITISMSKIQTLRDCPKRYKFRYIDRVPVPEKEKPSLALSQALRQTLRDTITSDAIFDIEKLQDVFSRRLAAAGPLLPETKVQLMETGMRALVNFSGSLNAKLPKVKCLGEFVKAPFENMVLTSQFDRVDLLPNGKLNVIVYKTSKKAMTIHEAHLDITGPYNFLIAHTLWPNQVENVIFRYLLTGDELKFTPSEKETERLKLALSEFNEEVSQGCFEGNRNPLCAYCDYVDSCADAKKLLLSPSKISAFLSCALKYRMRYIDRVPKDSRPTPHLNFDRSIHFALREFHENYDFKALKGNPLPGLLKKYWINEGYSDYEEEQRFQHRALAMLDDYLKSLTGAENPIMFETSATWSTDKFDLSVQIDRIDELPGGKLEIIDYKTGKKVPDERVLNEDMTLLNLFMACNQRWLGRIAKVSYVFLSANKKFTLVPTAQDIEAHKERVEKLVERIEAADYEPNKGALCAWCEFYGPCPEWKVKPYIMAGETPEVFRKRIRLSYSKMSLYLNCPRSYRKLYIDRIPPKPQPFFSFGTTIHETFENVYDPAHPIEKPSLEEVLRIYDEVRLTHREGFASEEMEEKYRQDGIRQITMYYNRFIRDEPFKPAYSIEDYFEIPCGQYAVMTGFIDRIDELEDGTYEILDYKTEPTMRSQDEVDHDKQLSIYYWACEDTLGLKISKLSLLMLDHDCKVETTRTRESIPQVVEQIDKTAYAMINETEFKPRKNKYCKSCDHLHDCPLKDEVLHDESLISMKKF